MKDWIETEGLICAAGEPSRANYVPAEDATVVARLRRAGAILLGKSNLHMDNPVYGRTSNPYDLSRSAGFSSSGEAAIIAAGGSPLGVGSDSGGSIRLPAAWCGVAGLKPSAGLVPLTGHHPRINTMSDPRTVIGPMARYVEDRILTLPLMTGTDWRDAGVIPMPLGDPAAVELKGLRVAFYTDDGLVPATAETIQVVRAAASALSGEGMRVAEERPNVLPESLPLTISYWRRPESASWEDWESDDEFQLTSEEVERSLFEWDRFRRAMLRFMEAYDVILCPAVDRPAVEHGTESVNVSYTLPYSLTGWPSVVLRGGTSPEGLPLAVQVVARPWRDDVALAVALYLERAFGGWEPPAGR